MLVMNTLKKMKLLKFTMSLSKILSVIGYTFMIIGLLLIMISNIQQSQSIKVDECLSTFETNGQEI